MSSILASDTAVDNEPAAESPTLGSPELEDQSEAGAGSLADGIRYLRGGSLDRAWSCFEAAVAESSHPAVQSEAYRRQADLKRRRAEWAAALQLSDAALSIAREHSLPDHAAAALNIQGTVHLQRGEFDCAIEVYHLALASGPHLHQRGLICQNLGTAYARQEMRAEASEWYARSSAAFRSAGCRREQILVLINKGNIHLDQGDVITADEIFREALEQIDSFPMGDAELRALVEINLAEAIARQETRLDEAFDLLISATGHFAVSENRPHQVACHRVFALISVLEGKPDLAVEALKRGGTLAKEIESPQDVAYFDRELARVGASLSAATMDPGSAQ